MARLKLEAEVNGEIIVFEREAPDAAVDAAVLAWAEAAYPGDAETPLSGSASILAALTGAARGILDNINRHTREAAKAAAEAGAPQIVV